MADKQVAPQAHEDQMQSGSIREAQEVLLGLMESEEEKPETEEAAPTEEEESTEETQDESLEEESEEEAEEEESEESDDEDEEALYAVTVNGEEHEVSLDELMKGYSRQSDYTKKTQELSQGRKEIEEAKFNYDSALTQMQQERQHYVNQLNQILQNSSNNLQEYNKIDWDALKEDDPIEYVKMKEDYREGKEKMQALDQQRQMAMQQQQAEAQKVQQEVIQGERAKMVEAIPEWGDPEKQKELATDVKNYALSQGFSEEELNSLVDHRSVLVLMKAAKYDALENADVKSKKLKNKPKVIRAGSGKTKGENSKSKRAAKMKRLQGTGHVDDAASILEDLFNS
jgi:cytochrome oxidase Cu insertion factor (SCO1/SenC/PrrC family)